MFQSNRFDLIFCQLLWRCAGRGAGLAEESIEAGRGGDPEEQEFVGGILKGVPGVPGDEDGSAFFKSVGDVVEGDRAAAFENIKGFVVLEVSMSWNACAERHLLGSEGELVGAGC